MSTVTVTTIASLLDKESISYGLTPMVHADESPAPGSAAASSAPAAAPEPPRLSVNVVWGDLAQQAADIHVVGHYQGVMPGGSEAALDRIISMPSGPGLIAEHTRRRWLVGSLGEITYFPGLRDDGPSSCVHRVAVAGMGRPGTFGDANAQQLFASLLRELSSLPDVNSVAMVLIGAGSANLSVPRAARALMRGFTTVLKAAGAPAKLPEIRFVEHDRLRAERLSVALRAISAPGVQVGPRIMEGAGGAVHPDSAAVFAVRAIAQAIRRERTNAGEDATSVSLQSSLTAALPEPLRSLVIDQLSDIPDDVEEMEVHVGRAGPTQDSRLPTRISVMHDADTDTMRWAALTDRATVPERKVPIRHDLVSDLARRLTAPSRQDGEGLAPMLRRWVVPSDFQGHICASVPLVFEVDGEAARLPWELLTDESFEVGDESLPLVLRTPIARQLRTGYAKAMVDREDDDILSALVIADPGPRAHGLPGARQEGLEVAELLRRRGVRTTLFVGSPDNPPPDGTRMAIQLDVLNELLTGRFDIVHFAGHGIMSQPDRPETAGWLFSDGVLAARELAQLTMAPQLIVANACWTAAGLGSAANAPVPSVGRAQLTAVLAEEFLRAGVTHFIGTSWGVPDAMARGFATALYDQVVPDRGELGEPIGMAVMRARGVLYADLSPDKSGLSPEELYAWAAYQHYGDPADVLYRLHSPDPNDAD